MAIYKRGRVHWYDFYFQGERYHASTHSSNRRVAEQIVATLRAALARGEVGIREKKTAPRFLEFWQQALGEIKNDNPGSPRTHDFYETNFKKCLEFAPLAKAKLDAIDEELLSQFRQHLTDKEKLQAPTVNRRLGTVRRALYIAQRWKLIERVPAFPFMSEKGHGREFILTPALKQEFLAKSPAKYRIIFEFLLETGLRVTECVQLTWDRVFLHQAGEFGRPFIYIRGDRERQITIKSKRTRRVPLFERALNIVKAQQKVSKSGYVFVQWGARVGKERQFLSPFSRHDVSRAFRSTAQAMGLPADAVLHSTRHTMLSELGAAGADAATIQLIAGHEDIRTSQRYLHPTPENVVRAFERMHLMRRETAEDLRPELTWVAGKGGK
jgi:integrase/recombinase XerC